jgi:hypothetical protein
MKNSTTTYEFISRVSLKAALSASLIFGTLVSGFSATGRIATFDAPGAGTGAGEGTFPLNINDCGDVIGFFIDANVVPYGFIR